MKLDNTEPNFQTPIQGWHSWDPMPWKHPWLTPKNLEKMRAYSKEKLQQLRVLVEKENPQKYRFGFCGGMANNMYMRLVALRRKGIDIRMFLHPQDTHVMSQPAWEEFEGILQGKEIDINELKSKGIKFPEVSGVECYPGAWRSREYLESQPFLDSSAIDQFPSYMFFIDTYVALQNIDVILTTQVPYFAYLSGRPYIAVNSGGDLWYEAARGDELGVLQRKSFEKAEMILVSNPWTYAHARRYNFKHLIYLPLMLDQEIYKPGIGKAREVWAERTGGSFFILATARLDEYYKGFSYWLDAVADFLHEVPEARLCITKWGEDKNIFLEKAIALGIQDKIIWLPLSGKGTIRDYLRSADCLIDQFVIGYYGATALEAMACGLPVIARFEMEQYAAVCETGAPPILQAETKEEVVSHLLNLFKSLSFREESAKKHRAWFLENHGSERWIPDYLAVLTAVASGQSILFNDSPLHTPLAFEEHQYHVDSLSEAPLFPNYTNKLVNKTVDKAVAKAVKLRELPYPYAHAITFVSDVDMQSAWYGVAFHHLVNEILGLPISDSLWVHGNTPENFCTLFHKANALNRVASGVDGHPIYGLLIRQWHRGNIDHLHGWHSDGLYRIKNEFSDDVQLKLGCLKFEIPSVPSECANVDYQNIRFVFNKKLPSDLSISLRDEMGIVIVISSAEIGRARNLFPKKSDYGIAGIAVDIMLQSLANSKEKSMQNFKLSRLKEIKVEAPSCKNDTELFLKRIERDSFSRQTVLEESEYLKKWNIRPMLLTAHGGFTMSHNPGLPIENSKKLKGEFWKNPQIDADIKAGASDLNSYAYHTDVLYNLGVKMIWEPQGKQTNIQNAPLVSDFLQDNLYSIARTSLPEDCLVLNTLDNFKNYYEAYDACLKEVNLEEMYLGDSPCAQGWQGAMSGVMLALGLKGIELGKKVNHFWFTHLGTLPYVPNLNLTADKPLTSAIEIWFRKLANHYYNFIGTLPLAHRVWVPPATLYTNYQIIQKELPEHVFVSQNNSVIKINRWVSSVTKRLMIDPLSGTQDLHGITIYVRDPKNVCIYIDEDPVTTFTKNDPDESGHASVTFVDDNTPTVIFGKVPLSINGEVKANNALFLDLEKDGVRQSSDITAEKNGQIFIKYTPQQLDLWNTSHIHLVYRKHLVQNSEARLFIQFVMEDGQTIGIEENINEKLLSKPMQSDAVWLIPKTADGAQLSYETLSLDRLNYNIDLSKLLNANGGRPPLPIGRIKEIYVGMRTATKEDKLCIERIVALRPSTTHANPKGEKFIMGRVVLNGGSPLRNTIVTLEMGKNKFNTVTDDDGYYTFHAIPKGSVVKLAAQLDNKTFISRRGAYIEMAKDEVEIDIDVDVDINVDVDIKRDTVVERFSYNDLTTKVKDFFTLRKQE